MRLVSRLFLPFALALAFLVTGVAPDALASKLSQKTYEGKRRLSKAANGGGADLFNRTPGVRLVMGGDVTSRRVKVTKLSTTTHAHGAKVTRFKVETIKRLNGVPVARAEIVVKDQGGTARFFRKEGSSSVVTAPGVRPPVVGP